MSTHGGTECGGGLPKGWYQMWRDPDYQAEPRLWPLPRPKFMDTYGNPNIICCSCGCIERDKPCRNGRRILTERQQYNERRELLAVLTDEDKAWLAEHGWRP